MQDKEDLSDSASKELNLGEDKEMKVKRQCKTQDHPEGPGGRTDIPLVLKVPRSLLGRESGRHKHC